MLIQELGIDPGVELQQLHTAILHHEPSLSQTDTSISCRRETPNNLPANLASFIGRQEELDKIPALLQAVRLVTVTGAGGAGKSRLATEIAARQTSAFPDGVWIVELAALVDPQLIAPATSTVLGIREHPERGLFDLLVARLQPATALLVLDNCEHFVTDVAEFVQRLLDACPRLRILCTSRERLGITGEFVRPISGLRVPEPGSTNTSLLREVDAVRLFADRASAVQPGFELSDDTVIAIGEICQHLDGLPLAIELAAARINTYSATQIAVRLSDRFQLLTQGSRTALPRHRTLRAVVEWSYELLSGPERRIFDRLAVFAGGFTFEAADTICTDPVTGDDLSETLSHLVDKSLVMAEALATPEYRYRLLETLRAYGAERLQARDEASPLHVRHSAFFLSLAKVARLGLRGADQSVWLERLSTEHDNFRAALEYSLAQGDTETAAWIAASLYPFWDLRGHYTEGRRWLTGVLAADGVSERARIRVLLGATALAAIQGDTEQAIAACEEAEVLSREATDRAGLALALLYQGFMAIHADEHDRAAALLNESLESARIAEAAWEHGWALLFLSVLALARADFEQAWHISQQADAVLEPVGDQRSLAWNQAIRGVAAWGQGNINEASLELRSALRAFNTLGGLWGQSVTLLFSSLVLASQGRNNAVARVLGTSDTIRASAGVGMFPFVRRWRDRAIADTKAVLGPVIFQRERRAGQNSAHEVGVFQAIREFDKLATDPTVPSGVALADAPRQIRQPSDQG
jgi:non-specific serine/threonine protein kinase